MTLYRYMTVVCDGCGEQADAAEPTGSMARDAARATEGWATGLPGGRDLCSRCRRKAR